MGSVVSSILGGKPDLPKNTGPSAAELEAKRKADDRKRREQEERMEQQSRDKAAMNRAAMRRAGLKSTIATGSSGLETVANTASKGTKKKLGQ